MKKNIFFISFLVVVFIIIGIGLVDTAIRSNKADKIAKSEATQVLPPVEKMPGYGNGKIYYGTVVEIPKGFLARRGDFFMIYINPSDKETQVLGGDRIRVIVPRFIFTQDFDATFARIHHSSGTLRPHTGVPHVGDMITYYRFAVYPMVNMMTLWKKQ